MGGLLVAHEHVALPVNQDEFLPTGYDPDAARIAAIESVLPETTDTGTGQRRDGGVSDVEHLLEQIREAIAMRERGEREDGRTRLASVWPLVEDGDPFAPLFPRALDG